MRALQEPSATRVQIRGKNDALTNKLLDFSSHRKKNQYFWIFLLNALAELISKKEENI